MCVTSAILIALTGCGADEDVVMPDVESKRLDVALSDLERAGVEDDAEVLGGGMFGVLDESNWEVCDQEPTAGGVVGSAPRLTVDRTCDTKDDDDDGEWKKAERPTQTKSPEVRDDNTEPTGATESPKTTEPPKETTSEQRPDVDRERVKDVVRLYAVLRVIDGDTVEVSYRGDTSIRIIGIDTPETVDPNTPDECGGAQATALANELLSGQQVQLVFDKSQGRTDYYDRALAYLDVPGVGDFGKTMIKRGAAAEYTYDTAYDRQAKYIAAERRAQSKSRGVWGKCGGVDTPLKAPAPTADPPKDKQKGKGKSGGGGSACGAGYQPCIPPYPPDLNCEDVGGPIRVSGDDPHGLDADGDGSACES
jgi:endonuclease YncB( thermonuclease family)